LKRVLAARLRRGPSLIMTDELWPHGDEWRATPVRVCAWSGLKASPPLPRRLEETYGEVSAPPPCHLRPHQNMPATAHRIRNSFSIASGPSRLPSVSASFALVLRPA